MDYLHFDIMDENLNNEFVKSFSKSLLACLLESTNCASRLYRSVLLSDSSELADKYWEIYVSVRDLYETLLKSNFPIL